MRTEIAKWLDKKAGEYGERALVTVALGSVFWPLLPVGLAYTVGCFGASGLARVVRGGGR